MPTGPRPLEVLRGAQYPPDTTENRAELYVFLRELVTKDLWDAALAHVADVAPPEIKHDWLTVVWIIMHTAKVMWRLRDQSVIHVRHHRERDQRP